MAERVQVPERRRDAAVGVEHDLAGRRHAGERVADRDHRHRAGDRAPVVAGRPNRRGDQAIHAVVDETPGQLELTAGLAVGVRDERVEVAGTQLAHHGADELLVPEVGEAAHDHANHSRRAAAQRAGDRVSLVADLLGGPAHPLDRVVRHVDPA